MAWPRKTLLGAFAIALGASTVSLALSEVLGLVPCELCWYQRLLLYPQVLILGAAIVKPQPKLPLVALGLSFVGSGVAAYHSWIQIQPATSDTCSLANPCSAVTLEIAGFSIPNLSLFTFLVLSGILLFYIREIRR